MSTQRTHAARGLAARGRKPLCLAPGYPSALGPVAPGFNLVEVMFSILILGIGLIAVASLFPIAGSIQRDTVDDLQAWQTFINAQESLVNKPFRLHDPATPPNPLFDFENLQATDGTRTGAVGTMFKDGSVFKLIRPIGAAQTTPHPLEMIGWPLADREYPAPALLPAGTQPDYYWVPLFRWDADSGRYQAYIFVMKNFSGEIPDDANDHLVSSASTAAFLGDYFVDPTPDLAFNGANTLRTQGGLPTLKRMGQRTADTGGGSVGNTTTVADPYAGAETRWHAQAYGTTPRGKYMRQAAVEGGPVR